MLIEQAIQHSFIQAAAIIFIAVVIESIWRIPAKYHPLTLFRLLAFKLEKKVNHPERGRLQNQIAGCLGFVSLVAPFFIILYLALEIVYFRWFFDGFILFIALSSITRKTGYNRVFKYLSSQNKVLARECLSAVVLRKTDQLTPMGCAKAAMEAYTLRFYYEFASIIFWFFTVGPLFALFARLVSEFHQTWNTRLLRFQYFGAPVALLNRLLQWLPCAAHSLLLGLLYRPIKTLKQWLLHLHLGSRQFILACTAYAVPCALGGPTIYAVKKVRFKRHCEQIEVRLGHMSLLRRYIQLSTVVLIMSYVLIAISFYLIGFDLA